MARESSSDPRVIGAVVHLMDRAGAHRVRLLESAYATAMPLDEFMFKSGWNADVLARAGRRVEFENTNFPGMGTSYPRVNVPPRAAMLPAYELHPSAAATHAGSIFSTSMMGAHQVAVGTDPTRWYRSRACPFAVGVR